MSEKINFNRRRGKAYKIKWLGKNELRAFEHSQKNKKEKLDYSELREEIHKILCDFLDHEHSMQNDGEFDFEYLEFRTDEILRLIKRQGGSIPNKRNVLSEK